MPAVPVPGRTASGRPVAPGGWRRAVVGVLVGVAAGVAAVAGLATPPEEPEDGGPVGADGTDRARRPDRR